MNDNENRRPLTYQFTDKLDRLEVGLFIPPAEDSSTIVANTLADKIVRNAGRINLRLFLAEQRTYQRYEESELLRRKQFLHGGLLNDVVFPYQREIGSEQLSHGVLWAPDLLADKYPGRVIVEHVPDINDPTFVEERIRQNETLMMGFSARNLRHFDAGIREAFEEKMDANFVNSHPAPLPDIRGLEGPFWSNALGLEEYATTLHIIEEEYDAGAIIGYKSMPIDRFDDMGVGAYPRHAAPEVASMMYDYMHLRLVRGGRHPGLKMQDDAKSEYRSIPTPKELRSAMADGVKIIDAQEQMNWLGQNFAEPTDRQELLLEMVAHYRDNFEGSDNNAEAAPGTDSDDIAFG